MGDLRRALDRNELQLHYQAKLRLADRHIDGCEALVRWPHPVRGTVPPDSFIPLAEETGNIRPLTRWALATAIVQAREWARRGHALRVAVNLSARDLDDAELPQRIAGLLAAHDVPARALVLELTESAVMIDPTSAVRSLGQLADLGIDLAIDDFGVGQSSFAYLRRLPVREIKIDRSFTRGLGTAAGDPDLVASIVDLGHRLGYRVTAEGVETTAALDALAAMGCDHAQGFRIARPSPAAVLEALLGRDLADAGTGGAPR
jgi:EAL domain-containing protein (putative c-di-GMP-specific phosphodiesterase class I)